MAVKKRRRRRNSILPILSLLMIATSGFVVYMVVFQSDWIINELFGRSPEAVPANIQAAQPTISDVEPTLTDAHPTNDSEAPTAGTNQAGDAATPTADTPDNPYAQFSFYIPDKLSEYESYHTAHPEFDAETAVWRVNAGLNRPFFEDATIVSGSNPLLVNPYNRLPEDFEPAALVVIDDANRMTTPETFEAFKRMQADAQAEGLELYVQSAYRTIAYQMGLYERSGGSGSVARPMFSEHHTGRTIDLGDPRNRGHLLDDDNPRPLTPEGIWVAENAYKYGFIVRYQEAIVDITGYPPEPWHITYVGEPIARAMHDNQILSLEEYVAKNPDASLP